MSSHASILRAGGFVAICFLAGSPLCGLGEEPKSAARTAGPSYKPIAKPGQDAPGVLRVEPISDALRKHYDLDPFYKKAVVIDGILANTGMLSFTENLTAAEAEALRSYVVSRAHETQ